MLLMVYNVGNKWIISVNKWNILFKKMDDWSAAQKHPEEYRDLLVRVAGYSDYFNDMNTDLQYDVIARTAQETF